MRAIEQVGYGSPVDVLRLADVEVPEPAAGEVRVRVRAASINAIDWHAVLGTPMLVRLMGGWRRPRNPRAIGYDTAGIVDAVGEGVTELHVGDEAYGTAPGALAEYVTGANFVRKPANLSFEQAAALPVAGRTALQAVVEHGHVQPGQSVLVHGAGGGVGTFCVLVAKAFGARVTAVTRTAHRDMLRRLGADAVVDYHLTDFARSAERYDLIIDVGGNRSVGDMRRVLTAGGRIVLVGAGKGRFGVFTRIIGARLRAALGQPVKFFISTPRMEQLVTLRELAESGRLAPAIDRVYPLERAAEAIAHVATEGAGGKVIVKVADAPT
jgi:NADPH:quinone reductase-like Zn-dependent oxidoreductase